MSDGSDSVLESTDCIEVLQTLISRAVSDPQSCTPEMLSAITMLVTKLIHKDVSLERLSRSWEAGCVKKILQVCVVHGMSAGMWGRSVGVRCASVWQCASPATVWCDAVAT